MMSPDRCCSFACHLERNEIDAAYRQRRSPSARPSCRYPTFSITSGWPLAVSRRRNSSGLEIDCAGFRARAPTGRPRSFVVQERRADAEKEYAAALAAKPDLLEALLGLAKLQRIRLACEEARVLYERAEAVRPTFDGAYGLGVCLGYLQNDQLAVKQFEQAVQRNPSAAVAWAGLGTSLVKVGRRGRHREAAACGCAGAATWTKLITCSGWPTTPPETGVAQECVQEGRAVAQRPVTGVEAARARMRARDVAGPASPWASRNRPRLQARQVPQAAPNAAARTFGSLTSPRESGVGVFQHVSGGAGEELHPRSHRPAWRLIDFDGDGLARHLPGQRRDARSRRRRRRAAGCAFRNHGAARSATSPPPPASATSDGGRASASATSTTTARPISTSPTSAQPAVSQRRRRPIHRCRDERRRRRGQLVHRLRVSATTTATAGSICTLPATSRSTSSTRHHVRHRSGSLLELAAPHAGGAGRAWAPRTHAGAPFCTYRGEPVMCGPRGLRGAPDHLFRNNGDGTFADVDRRGGRHRRQRSLRLRRRVGRPGRRREARSAGGQRLGPNYVYRNAGDGSFEDVSYPSGVALDGNGREQAHMGVAIGDYDNDGRDDIHITNFADDFNVLYHNDDGATFTDVSFRSGWRRPRFRFSAGARAFSTTTTTAGWICSWSTATSTRGGSHRLEHLLRAARAALPQPGRRPVRRGRRGGRSRLTTARVARGSAVGDLDNDGRVDVVAQQHRRRPDAAPERWRARPGTG